MITILLLSQLIQESLPPKCVGGRGRERVLPGQVKKVHICPCHSAGLNLSQQL